MPEALSRTEVYSLLSKLCVDLGFCLSPDDIARLQQSPPPSAVQFTDAIFLAEGLDPATADKSLWRQVHEIVANAFENASVS